MDQDTSDRVAELKRKNDLLEQQLGHAVKDFERFERVIDGLDDKLDTMNKSITQIDRRIVVQESNNAWVKFVVIPFLGTTALSLVGIVYKLYTG